jgi:PAS domain S-box-containing protein
MDNSRHLALLLESAPIAIVTVDPTGTILYTNTRLNELFGYERGELLGQPLEVLIPERFRGLHEQHRQAYFLRPHVRPMGTGMDLAGRRKDGSEFPIEAGLSHIAIGDAQLVMGSIIDVSRRKQIEEILETRVQQRTRELERRRQVSDGLRDTLATLNSNRSLDEILNHIVTQAVHLLYAEAGAIYSLESTERTPILRAHHGIDSAQLHAADMLGAGGDDDMQLEYTIVNGSEQDGGDRMHLATVQRPRQNPTGRGLLETGFQAMLSVPLLVKDEVYGNLMLYYESQRKFSPEEIDLALAVGDQAALAIENARLRAHAERSAIAAERNRIARDLHDSVTQTLFSATVIAEVLPKLWQRDLDESNRRLEELRQLTRGALAEMRTLLLELRPATLIEVEVGELLRQLVEAATGRARFPIRLQIDGACALPPDVKVAYYHIAQEALNNVAKHARASEATVHLDCTGRRHRLSIRDNGRGFVVDAVTAEHLGLTIMRERAEGVNAQLEVQSEINRGTHISVTWLATLPEADTAETPRPEPATEPRDDVAADD